MKATVFIFLHAPPTQAAQLFVRVLQAQKYHSTENNKDFFFFFLNGT